MVARKQTRKTARSSTRKTTGKSTGRTIKKTTKKTTKKATKTSTANRPAIRTAWTKTQIVTGISDNTGLTRKEVTSVFTELEAIMSQHLKSGGAGQFTLPGMLKAVTKRKPATKARKGINPFTGEMTTFKAKPAKNIVKIRPLKKLKDIIA